MWSEFKVLFRKDKKKCAHPFPPKKREAEAEVRHPPVFKAVVSALHTQQHNQQVIGMYSHNTVQRPVLAL